MELKDYKPKYQKIVLNYSINKDDIPLDFDFMTIDEAKSLYPSAKIIKVDELDEIMRSAIYIDYKYKGEKNGTN